MLRQLGDARTWQRATLILALAMTVTTAIRLVLEWREQNEYWT